MAGTMNKRENKRKLAELSRNLVIRRVFLRHRERSLDDLYSTVKQQFTSLCNNEYRCSDNCNTAHSQPEWQHKVRTVLNNLKKRNLVVRGLQPRCWKLMPDGLTSSKSTGKRTSDGTNYDVKNRSYSEGAIRELTIELRSRDSNLRKDAISLYGETCQVCGFHFGNYYGDDGQGYIEVHHLKPLSEQKRRFRPTVDDVRVVCANCHRMLHRRGKAPMNIDILKAMLQKNRRSNNNGPRLRTNVVKS